MCMYIYIYTLVCFACGKGKDELCHYMRCPCVAFIFKLPVAYGSLHKAYFNDVNLARLAVFF